MKLNKNRVAVPVTQVRVVVSSNWNRFLSITNQIFHKTKVFFTPEKTRAAKQLCYGLALLLVVIQAVIGVLIYGAKSDDRVTRAIAAVIPYPVAVANLETTSYGDYLFERDYIRHFYSATQQQNIDFKEIDAQILDQLIENELIKSEASRFGVRLTKTEINQTLNSVIEQNGGQEKVNKVLSDLYGIDIDSFKRLITDQMLRDKINQDIITKVTASHILVRVDRDAPQDKTDEAKSKIDSYLAEVRAGANFADVAKKNSEDVGSNEQGGKLEPFGRDEMVKEFSDTAFSTPVGSISDPVRTDFGWHIIKVEARNGKIDLNFTDWLENLKSRSLIVKFI